MLKRLLYIFFSCYLLSAYAGDKTIVVLGDSISAGYGISMKDGWVHLLQEQLTEQGYNYQVINASISGDTTRGASIRIKELMETIKPEIVIVELGGNDGLRGLSIEEMYQNLEEIIEYLIEHHVDVMLIPMRLPPNYGEYYNDKFERVYRKLANAYDIILGRFILAEVADKPELMQADGIHPKAGAQVIMMENVWMDLEKMIKTSN